MKKESKPASGSIILVGKQAYWAIYGPDMNIVHRTLMTFASVAWLSRLKQSDGVFYGIIAKDEASLSSAIAEIEMQWGVRMGD